MDGTDADGEWSDEEAVRSGSNTGVSETEADEHQMVTIKRPQPCVVVSSLSNIRLMTSADPLSADDPVNSILDRIDAEIEAMDIDHPTDLHKMASSKSSRPGSNGRTKSNHSRQPLYTTQVPSLNLSKSMEQEDTDTGLGSASFRGDEGSNTDKINGTAEVYSEAALTDALTDEDNTAKAPDDVPSDLDSLVAQQIDCRFKEIMRKKKVPPDLPMHPGKPTASGSLSSRLRSRNVVRPSATMLSTGYGTDNESVKTEDFEAKFMNMLVTSDNEKPANETTLEKRTIKNQKTLPECRNGELETPVITETLPSPPRKDVLGNQSGDDDDMIQRLRSIANGKQSPKTSAVSLPRPRSLSPSRLRLHRYRTSDNLRGIWDSASSLGSAKGSSQVFSWDDDFWRRRSQTSGTSTSNSTFEEVESLCFSKSSNDSHFGGLSRSWDRWGRNAASNAFDGRGVPPKTFLSRQSSETSTSNSWSSGPLGDLQSNASSSSRNSKSRGGLQSLLESMELLSRQGGLDPAERLYLDKIFQRVMEYNSSKSSMESSRDSPTHRGVKDRVPSQPSDLARLHNAIQDTKDGEERFSKQKAYFADIRRNVLDGKTRRRRDLILPEEDDRNNGVRTLHKKNTNSSKSDHDLKSPTGSSFTTDSSLNSSKFFASVSSNREYSPPKEGRHNDAKRPSLAMFMSRNSLNKGGGSFDSTASPTDPFNSFTAPYSASHAERVLMGLGFGSAEGFLPERFLRDWYAKVSMAHELEAREQGENDPESSEKIPLDTSSPNAQPTKPRAPMRRDSHLSFASSSLDEAANLPPVNNGSDSRIQRLQEYLDNFSSNYGSNNVDVNTRIQQFANSRQKSLPLCLETLSEEEDSRSRVPGVDPFDKEHKLRMFICDEISNSNRSTASNSEQSVVSSSQSENDSLSGCSDSHRRSNSRKATKTSKPYSVPVEQKYSHGLKTELQETKSSVEQKTDVQRFHNTDQQNKHHPDSKIMSNGNKKISADDKNEGVLMKEEHKTTHQPPSSALSRSTIQFSNDSLEVADIMQNKFSEPNGATTNSNNVTNVTKKAIKMVEPAMVSIVLEDVDEGVKWSVGDKSCIRPDSGHLSIPMSAQALSPIPQSPVTVIEVGLDNQQDSLDTEEGTGSSRDADEEMSVSHQCENCGRYSHESRGDASHPSSHRRRSRPHHQDTVRRVGFPVGPNLTTTSDEDSETLKRTSSVSKPSEDVPTDNMTYKEGPNSEAEKHTSPLLNAVCDKVKTGKCYDERSKTALHPYQRSSRSDSSSSSKSPTAVKRKNLKRQKARQGKSSLPFDGDVHGEKNEEPLSDADDSSISKLRVSPSSKRHLLSLSHPDLGVGCGCHGCHQHSLNQHDHRCHHHHRHPPHLSHDTKFHATSCQHVHKSCQMRGSPRKTVFSLPTRNFDNDPNFSDSAFKTTKKSAVMKSTGTDGNDLETSETDPNEFPSVIDKFIEPRSIISVRKALQLSNNEQSHNRFNSGCTAHKTSPVIFSSDMASSPTYRRQGDGRIQSISRAVQANLYHDCSIRNSLNQCSLHSGEYFLAHDQEVQCSLRKSPCVESGHLHKCVQTINPQLCEVSCQTNEGFNIPLNESAPTESNKIRKMAVSKAINTVLCLIGKEHDNFPWDTEFQRKDKHSSSLWSNSHFRLVDETLNQIEQELTAIDQKNTQNDPKNIQNDAVLDVHATATSNSREMVQILNGPLSETVEIRTNLNVSEMSIFDKTMRKSERNEISFSPQSPTAYNVDLEDRLQECINKMDIQKEMKDYLSPCSGMYSSDPENITDRNIESNIPNCQTQTIPEDSTDSIPSSKMASNADVNHSQSGDLNRCHNKLSRLKYIHNSHQNSCNSLDVETDFMNAGDPLGSLDGTLLTMNSPDPDNSFGDESPIDVSSPVKTKHGAQGLQACPHLPSYLSVTEASSPDNLLTDKEDAQLSSHSTCCPSSGKRGEDNQVTNQMHDKLRRLVPLAKKRAVMQANSRLSPPHVNTLSAHELNNTEGSSSITGPSESGRSALSSIDGSEDYVSGVVNPLSVKFQMDFLKVPESPKTLSKESYPDIDSKIIESSSASRPPTGIEGCPASRIVDPNAIHQIFDLKRPDSETITNVNQEDKSIQSPIFAEEEKTWSSDIKTELPNTSVQSSIDSFTNVSEFDSLKKSLDGIGSSDVNKTPSDMSFGTQDFMNSQSDMPPILTDDCSRLSQNQTSVKVCTLWKNVHCKAENTVAKPVQSLRRHNTWEGSRFSYVFSLPNQVSIDSASDRSVAGSDRVEDIDDAEILMFQSREVRRDSDSTYSEPDLGIIDNLSQSSISSAGNHIEGKDRTLFNVSPNIRFDRPLVSDTCLRSTQTATNEVSNCLCTAYAASRRETFQEQGAALKPAEPVENATRSNLSPQCIPMHKRAENIAIESEYNKDRSNKIDHLLQLNQNLPDAYGDNSSGDECDKEIGRINIRPNVRKSLVPMPIRPEHKHSIQPFNPTGQKGIPTVNDNQLESQSYAGINDVADSIRKSQTENETLLQKFQAAQLSSLLHQTAASVSHPLPQINIKDTSTSKMRADKISSTDKSNQSNAVVLSVEFDIDQPEFTHPQNEKGCVNCSQDVPTTLIDELEVMALFKSMQDIDSYSEGTISPRCFRLSQITEEETQSEESPAFNSRGRFNFSMLQSQPTSDTLVEVSPTKDSDVVTKFPTVQHSDISDQSENFDYESENNVSITNIHHGIQKTSQDETLQATTKDDVNTHDTDSSSKQVKASLITSTSSTNKKGENDGATKDLLCLYTAKDTDTDTHVTLDECMPCFIDNTKSQSSPVVLETVTVTSQRNRGNVLHTTSHSSAHVTQKTLLNFNVNGSKTSPPIRDPVAEQAVAHVSTLNIQLGDYRKKVLPNLSPILSLENTESNNNNTSPISSLGLKEKVNGDANLADVVKRVRNKDNFDLMERRKQATVTTMFSQGSEDEPQMYATNVGDTAKSRFGRHCENYEKNIAEEKAQKSGSKSARTRSREYLQLLHRQEQVYSSGESASDSDLTSALHVDSDIDLRERDLAMGRLAGDYMDDDDAGGKEEEKRKSPIYADATSNGEVKNENEVLPPINRISTPHAKPEDHQNKELCISDNSTSWAKRTNETPRVIVHQPSDDFQAHECLTRFSVSVDAQKTSEANDNHLHTKCDQPKKNKFINGPPVSHWSIPKDKEKAGRIWTRRLQRTQFLSPASALTITNSPEISASFNRHATATDDSHPELAYLDILSKLNGSHEKQKNAFLSPPDRRQTKSMMSPPPCIKITNDKSETYSDCPLPKPIGNNTTSNPGYTRCLNDYNINIIATPEIADNIYEVKKHNSDCSGSLNTTKDSRNMLSPDINSLDEQLTLTINDDELLTDSTCFHTSDSTEDSPTLDTISEDMADEGSAQVVQRNPKIHPLTERLDKLYIKSSSVTSKDSGFESNGK